MCKRGEIYYVEPYYTTGSEQRAGRPALALTIMKMVMKLVEDGVLIDE